MLMSAIQSRHHPAKDKPLLRSGHPKREGRSRGAALSLCRNYLDFGVVSSLSMLAPGTEVLSVSGEEGLAPTVFRSCFRA
jgi:hypothetical protein